MDENTTWTRLGAGSYEAKDGRDTYTITRGDHRPRANETWKLSRYNRVFGHRTLGTFFTLAAAKAEAVASS